jgi:carbon storage regulator
MMVMRRREGEKILIGDNIVIHITQVGRGRVKIGIDAPRDIAIVAEEVKRVQDENAAAAATRSADVIGPLLSRLQTRPA